MNDNEYPRFGGIELVKASEFRRWPSNLRRSALEIESVIQGHRACGLIRVFDAEVAESLKWFEYRNLSCICRQELRPFQFSPTCSAIKETLRHAKIFTIFFARTSNDARSIADSEAAHHELAGRLLGYPTCCISFAAKKDVIVKDATTGESRQSNLIALAIEQSSRFFQTLNILMREWDGFPAAPPSLIFHYPCSFHCRASYEIAAANLELGRVLWPSWHGCIVNLLERPILYWDDRDWPTEYADEFCGIVALGKYSCGRSGSILLRDIRRLGHGATPCGNIPQKAVYAFVGNDHVRISSLEGEWCDLDVSVMGQPKLIFWE